MPQPRRNGYAGRVPIPDVLATALLERVRRLNRTDRAVLMRASVIGPRFKFAVLSAVLNLSEERVRAALDEACALEFLIRETERGDWYAFRHALLRDIIREEFIGTRLRPLHRHITQALERCVEAREDPLDDLAYHSWASGDPERCVRYNELAGDRAVEVFANQDARTYYTRARAFSDPNSPQYRRLTRKLVSLQDDEQPAPGAQMRESQSEQGDCATGPLPPIRRTPR